MGMRRLFQIVAWLLLLAIIGLSVSPPQYRPVTPAPHDVEHSGIFVLTGLTFGLGYERWRLGQALALVAFSAAIELVQIAIPGRHSRFSDFLVDALSVCAGVGLAVLVDFKLKYWYRRS